MNLDFKKYKRIFAFGCSFTHYKWPTWADLISIESPDAIYRNYGFAGMGNLAISTRIIEGSKRFNFNSDDLILVMWSTFCREDRWLNGRWFTQGSVYNSTYPEDWIRDYTDPNGYLIRDHALIYSTNQYIKSLDCDSVILKSSPFDYTETNPDKESAYVRDQLSLIYKNDYNNLPLDFYTFNGSSWGNDTQEFFDDYNTDIKIQTWRTDIHPFSGSYVKYLEFIGIKLSDSTKRFANTFDEFIKRKPKITEMNKNIDFLRQNVDLGVNRIF
jgi:hypothetical protein